MREKRLPPLPPYARTARVVDNCIWIRCGQRGWRFVSDNKEAGEIVFPGDNAANTYDWSFARGLHCYVIGGDAPFNRVAGLVVALLLSGAPSITCIDRRDPKANASGRREYWLEELLNA